MMKVIGAVILLLLPSASGITSADFGCEGGEPAAAVGTPISTLEEAGFLAVIQQLIIDPEVPISITSDAGYKFRIVAPDDLYFNAFLMLGEFNKDSDSVVLNPTFRLEPISDNVMESDSCLGNVIALVQKDTEPKQEVEGRFVLDQTGPFNFDLTVVVLDEAGSESVYYSRYNFTSISELPDVPTVTPQLLAYSPTGAPTNASTRPPVDASLLLPSASGITSADFGCEGGKPAVAVGTPISTLEEAGFLAVIQQLIIDPKVPISITSDAGYKLKGLLPLMICTSMRFSC